MIQKSRHVWWLFVVSATLGSTLLMAEDDAFIRKHSAANKSFIKGMAKNRAHSDIGGSHYTKVNGDDEFKQAMESGALEQKSSGSRIQKQYNYIDISNVRVDRDDLKNSSGEDLTIGTRLNGERDKVVQAVDIKNSKIETDRALNVGVVSSSNRVSGVTSVNTIDHSELSGNAGRRQHDSSLMELEDMSLADQ